MTGHIHGANKEATERSNYMEGARLMYYMQSAL